jgi:lipopolysaccharide/colanic/teichoic acid biosynthesis glycosyltransferase
MLSGLLLILGCWLLLLIIFAYWITLEFPVFFRQRRIGKDEKIFTVYKFRTLKNSTLPLHHRTFWLGNILRFTSLDELPQLFNILKGEMSIVGPRPLPEEYLLLFSDEQRERHRVLPGVTGLAQVNGRHSLSWDAKFNYDIYYVRHISFILDCTILVKTIFLIFSFKKDTSLDESPFAGNNHA